MLTLSKKTDYALIAIGYLAEQSGRIASAREISSAYNMPAALLMNLLKDLNQHKILRSSRGTKGGYQLSADLHKISLYDIVRITDGDVHTTECSCETDLPCGCRVADNCPIQSPLKAFHHKMIRFLKDVKLSDLILPGHRIDVPLELVGVAN
jgi:Rrf2 family protein